MVAGHHEKLTYIGVDLPDRNPELLAFLRENSDVFAWTPSDIPGVDPTVITHRLNIDLTVIPIQQMRRSYEKVQLEAIKAEVKKLQEGGVIKELLYPTWLCNPVMVPKANGD